MLILVLILTVNANGTKLGNMISQKQFHTNAMINQVLNYLQLINALPNTFTLFSQAKKNANGKSVLTVLVLPFPKK